MKFAPKNARIEQQLAKFVKNQEKFDELFKIGAKVRSIFTPEARSKIAFFPHSEAPSETKESEFRFSEDTLLSSIFDIESFCGHLKIFS